MSMNKSELIDHVREHADISKQDATAAVNETIAGIIGALARDGSVTLAGFGKFETRLRPARIGRNPRSGASIEIPAKTTVRFCASKALKEAIS